MVFLSISDTQLLKPLDFLIIKSDKGVFCYVKDATLGKHLSMGLVASRANHEIMVGLEISVPNYQEGRRAED